MAPVTSNSFRLGWIQELGNVIAVSFSLPPACPPCLPLRFFFFFFFFDSPFLCGLPSQTGSGSGSLLLGSDAHQQLHAYTVPAASSVPAGPGIEPQGPLEPITIAREWAMLSGQTEVM